MSKITDALVAEMLGQLLFKKEGFEGKPIKQSRVDRVMAKYLEQTLIKKEERKDEKKEEHRHRHMGFLEQLILVAIGTYFFGLLQLIALHAFFK